MKTSTILALDIGDKRIGVALSDRSGLIARPHDIYLRAQGRAEREILQLVNEHDIKVIVVGLPLDENDRPTKQCESVRAFCRRLGKRADVEFVFVDEYCSSLEAEQFQRRGSKAGKKAGAKAHLDATAAAVLLQSYLDKDL